jgi:hypothetical protein
VALAVAASIDLLAIVSRASFPTGDGPAGDCFGLRSLAARRRDLSIRVFEYNCGRTEVTITGERLVLQPQGEDAIDFDQVRCALYLPICLEVEETLVSPIEPDEPYPYFAEQQWRPVTEFLEYKLQHATDCINPPNKVRDTNNKLKQFAILQKAGFCLPATKVQTQYPQAGQLASLPGLIAKNVSESGWKSASEFSPARLVARQVAQTAYPVIYQRPIPGRQEFRCYVMGDEVTFVALERQDGVVDVRTTNDGRPRARVSEGRADWKAMLVAMVKTLGLDYAVIDAIPDGDRLNILEINANGVWWFLPQMVGAHIETRFHAFLEARIAVAGGTATDRNPQREDV